MRIQPGHHTPACLGMQTQRRSRQSASVLQTRKKAAHGAKFCDRQKFVGIGGHQTGNLAAGVSQRKARRFKMAHDTGRTVEYAAAGDRTAAAVRVTVVIAADDAVVGAVVV